MKNAAFLSATAFAIFASLAALPLQAQTCAAPQTWQPGTDGQPLFANSTCSAEDNNGGGFCAGSFPAPGPAFILQLHLGPNRTFNQISVQSGVGVGQIIYVSSVSAGCGTDAACVASGTTIRSQDVPDGDWYFIITADALAANGSCGTFTLVSDGSLPVALQAFSID
jgi:hypothetical protein